VPANSQGWRLEVPALPRLAEVAAWRGSSTTSSTSSSSKQQDLSQQPHQAEQQQQQQQTGLNQTELGSNCVAAAAPAAQAEQGPVANAASVDYPGAAAAGIMGRITPSAASYHGGYYSMADVAQVTATPPQTPFMKRMKD
jgi:hypothetical protein